MRKFVIWTSRQMVLVYTFYLVSNSYRRNDVRLDRGHGLVTEHVLFMQKHPWLTHVHLWFKTGPRIQCWEIYLLKKLKGHRVDRRR